MSNTQQMQPTSFTQLQEYAKGTIIKFPDFNEGQELIVRVRRPSMLGLVKSGKIPNSLLNTANSLFTEGTMGLDEDNENMMSNVFEIIEALCEECFIEPTNAQLKEAGIKLTDEQMMFLFSYTQQGVNNLTPIHQEPQDSELLGNGATV